MTAVCDSGPILHHGSLGVGLWSARQRHLDYRSATAKLEALFRSSLWISRRVQVEARRALERICD